MNEFDDDCQLISFVENFLDPQAVSNVRILYDACRVDGIVEGNLLPLLCFRFMGHGL